MSSTPQRFQDLFLRRMRTGSVSTTITNVLRAREITYASKYTALAILYSSRRQIRVSPCNHSTIIECHIAANGSIDNIAAIVVSTNDLGSSTTEGRMGGRVILVTWCWDEQRNPVWIGYIQPRSKPDVHSQDGSDRTPIIILESR